MDKIIDGKLISSQIKNEIKLGTEKLKNEKNIVPGLAFILVGNNPASEVYVKNKGKVCDELGFYSVTKIMPDSITQKELIRVIQDFNSDDKIHGILVQLPLPKHIDELSVIEAIDYKKDVDGFHPQNIGRLAIGVKSFIPCTPYGIVELLKRKNIETSGKNVVVLGRSNIVGKPIGLLMLQKEINSTVTICHSATQNLIDFTSKADILIAAIGKPNFVKSNMIKERSVIIDVGINRIEDKNSKSGTKIVGDVDYLDCYDKCSMITPVPGGVGPMTIAMLMKNTFESAQNNIFF